MNTTFTFFFKQTQQDAPPIVSICHRVSGFLSVGKRAGRNFYFLNKSQRRTKEEIFQKKKPACQPISRGVFVF